jgi:hypothetical protein
VSFSMRTSSVSCLGAYFDIYAVFFRSRFGGGGGGVIVGCGRDIAFPWSHAVILCSVRMRLGGGRGCQKGGEGASMLNKGMLHFGPQTRASALSTSLSATYGRITFVGNTHDLCCPCIYLQLSHPVLIAIISVKPSKCEHNSLSTASCHCLFVIIRGCTT